MNDYSKSQRGSSRPSHSSASADFSTRNEQSRIKDTVNGVAQSKISNSAESSHGVAGDTGKQVTMVCRSEEYFCEVCEHYPLYPVHGHYECPQCRYKTKCCEGAPQ